MFDLTKREFNKVARIVADATIASCYFINVAQTANNYLIINQPENKPPVLLASFPVTVQGRRKAHDRLRLERANMVAAAAISTLKSVWKKRK